MLIFNLLLTNIPVRIIGVSVLSTFFSPIFCLQVVGIGYLIIILLDLLIKFIFLLFVLREINFYSSWNRLFYRQSLIFSNIYFIILLLLFLRLLKWLHQISQIFRTKLIRFFIIMKLPIALFFGIPMLIVPIVIVSVVTVILLVLSLLSIPIVSFVYAIIVLMPVITIHVFYKL